MLSDKLVTLSYQKKSLAAILNNEYRPRWDQPLGLIVVIDMSWTDMSWLILKSSPLLKSGLALQRDVQFLSLLYSDFHAPDSEARLVRSINFFEDIDRVASPVKRFLRAVAKLGPAVSAQYCRPFNLVH